VKTILVVEDTEDLRELFVQILRDSGYEARGVENGRSALELLDELDREPCLLLVDMMMPVMDGPTFIQRVQSAQHWATPPIVVVSASVTDENRPEGADEVINKPVSAEVLLQVVRDLCGPP
jgi:CheY-like chemotaxis protein